MKKNFLLGILILIFFIITNRYARFCSTELIGIIVDIIWITSFILMSLFLKASTNKRIFYIISLFLFILGSLIALNSFDYGIAIFNFGKGIFLSIAYQEFYQSIPSDKKISHTVFSLLIANIILFTSRIFLYQSKFILLFVTVIPIFVLVVKCFFKRQDIYENTNKVKKDIKLLLIIILFFIVSNICANYMFDLDIKYEYIHLIYSLMSMIFGYFVIYFIFKKMSINTTIKISMFTILLFVLSLIIIGNTNAISLFFSMSISTITSTLFLCITQSYFKDKNKVIASNLWLALQFIVWSIPPRIVLVLFDKNWLFTSKFTLFGTIIVIINFIIFFIFSEVYRYMDNKLSSKLLLTEILSIREAEIANYILKGMTRKEIAEIFFLSESTIKNHTKSILDKTNCKNQKELILKYK